MRQRLIYIFLVIVFLMILTGLSFWFGNIYAIGQIAEPEGVNNRETVAGVDFSPFWQAWNLIDNYYVNGNATSIETDLSVSNQERVWGAISGMVNSLGDPYTVFLPPTDKQKFEEDIAGNFGGVGMEIGIKEDSLIVVAPLADTPAKRAGIMAGDKIIEIDGESTINMSVEEAVAKIRGQQGTQVKLIINRDGEELDFSIIRAIITIPTLETELRSDGIFVISLYNFSAPAPNLFRQALREFSTTGSDKLILDLRGNPGGYLEASIDIASWFLPVGKVVLRETRKASGAEKAYRSYGYNVFSDNLKLVILIDQGSASASEILAGALSEYGLATLIGQTSFGKGSVQELIPLTEDTSLKVTVARWLTPFGHSISQNGLEPKIKVPITMEDIEVGQDPQLDKAVEYLLSL
jgi:carboxyl-terminal processing protease